MNTVGISSNDQMINLLVLLLLLQQCSKSPP